MVVGVVAPPTIVRAFMSDSPKPTRRHWWRRAGLVILAAASLLGLWAFVWEPSRLTVVERELPLPGLEPGLDGLRIAVVSDLHIGSPHVGLEKLQAVVDAIDAERPELVVLLGDLVVQGVLGGTFVEPERSAVELSRLKSPLGTVAVIGNHDAWLDRARVRSALEGQGVRVLEDECLRLTRGSTPFSVCGLRDLWTGNPDVKETLRAVNDGAPVLLLTHNPDVFPDVPPRVTLTLAGHTHGGQVSLPIVGRPIVPSRFGERFAAGIIREDGRTMFVTTGVGTSILPVRFRVVPEVAIVRLKRAD